MKTFQVYTGNRFHEVEAHLTSLGLRYSNGSTKLNRINALVIHYSSSLNYLTWGEELSKEGDFFSVEYRGSPQPN